MAQASRPNNRLCLLAKDKKPSPSAHRKGQQWLHFQSGDKTILWAHHGPSAGTKPELTNHGQRKKVETEKQLSHLSSSHWPGSKDNHQERSPEPQFLAPGVLASLRGSAHKNRSGKGKTARGQNRASSFLQVKAKVFLKGLC